MHFVQYSSTPSSVPPQPGQRGGAMILNSGKHFPQNKFLPSPNSTPQHKQGKEQTNSVPELKKFRILDFIFNFILSTWD